jgi:hypothetical protein
MIINKVILNNFYCFLDENEIEFSKGLNIISAVNSGGKSQLFNAFYWTFFDKIYADVDNNSTKKEWKSSANLIVCPDKIKAESQQKNTITCSVEISLTNEFHENDDSKSELVEYTFLKKVIYEKNGDSLTTFLKPELIISYVKNGETEFIPSHSHNWFLDKIFPVSIRKFMWYQGETMDELYDFSNPSTLKNAINEISYFPMYDNMEKIVKASAASIDRKVEKELSLQKKLTTNQQKLIDDINYNQQLIERKSKGVSEVIIDIEKLQDEIAIQEQQLQGYDKYRDIKEQINQLENELSVTKSRIDDASLYIKETLINKWMLNGCEALINASEKNLNILSEEIQNFQQSTNPVPISLPGPEYVEKMLDDKICYICEREVLEGTPPYAALMKRLEDFTESSNNKVLQDNYTELNRARRRLINDLPDVKNEITEKNKSIEALIKNRNRLNKKIENIFVESGDENQERIIAGASTAAQIMSKMQTLRNAKERKADSLRYLQTEIKEYEEKLRKDILERDSTLKNIASNFPESYASNYIKMFVKSIGSLRSIALTKLITEIQNESNRLYSLYLGGKTQGEIEIDNGIRIIDRVTKNILTNLNTAEIVAQKLAVANAFLSLSEIKMRKSYPIVADAPTSEFDFENTYSLTLNIGKSFDQMIIMSKDYAVFEPHQRQKLIQEANIVKFYEFKNEKIDKDGLDSRINKRTVITTIK